MKKSTSQYHLPDIIAMLTLTLTALLLFAACGGPAGAPPPTVPPTTSRTPTGKTATATLSHEPTGTATLTWTPGNKTLVVKMSLTGLAPNSKHPAHIHSGSCTQQGKALYSLNDVVADAHGNATTTTTIKNVSGGIPASSWFINVHNGPGTSPADQDLSIACTDIANTNISTASTQTVDAKFRSAPSSSAGQNVSGTATLSLAGTTLTVTTNLSGFVPNSSHAEHIHSGSCTSQGDVVYQLNPIKADGKGDATTTTGIKNVASIPSSGWYINIHNGTDMNNQTSFDPVACGDVVPGK